MTSTAAEVEVPIPLDVVFSVLRHPARRYVLTEIGERTLRRGDKIDSEQLVARGDDHDVRQLELYHKHLPKLHEAGFIDWNQASGTLTRGAHFDEIRPLIPLIQEPRDELPFEGP